MSSKKKSKKSKPPKTNKGKIYKMLAGQIKSMAKSHPEYFQGSNTQMACVHSSAKRVYGLVMSKDFQRLLAEASSSGADGAT